MFPAFKERTRKVTAKPYNALFTLLSPGTRVTINVQRNNYDRYVYYYNT